MKKPPKKRLTKAQREAQKFARKIGWPTAEWPTHCYAVAAEILCAGLVDGTLRYGHWLGSVAPGTLFHRPGSPRPFTPHGWIELPDGTICDPTRWVFENAAPYVYRGPADHYDVGGNQLRLAFLRPPPPFNPAEPSPVVLPICATVGRLLGPPPYSVDQVFWLANLPLSMLEGDARVVYEAIIAAGEDAMIPLDNRQLVMENDRCPRGGKPCPVPKRR
jgi:hypothetical protein